ncbi:hypothetical protein KSW81_004603 [Nannochloris sp. 'desiccata']|nr:hypothetical protein KSW81_004603 [Chlorella desiccata (nom. nud.)]
MFFAEALSRSKLSPPGDVLMLPEGCPAPIEVKEKREEIVTPLYLVPEKVCPYNCGSTDTKANSRGAKVVAYTIHGPMPATSISGTCSRCCYNRFVDRATCTVDDGASKFTATIRHKDAAYFTATPETAFQVKLLRHAWWKGFAAMASNKKRAIPGVAGDAPPLWALNDDRFKEALVLWRLTEFYSTRPNFYLQDLGNNNVAAKLTEACALWRVEFPKKWLPHCCSAAKESGCAARAVMMDGNAKNVMGKCAYPGCIHRPHAGNQYEFTSRYCEQRRGGGLLEEAVTKHHGLLPRQQASLKAYQDRSEDERKYLEMLDFKRSYSAADAEKDGVDFDADHIDHIEKELKAFVDKTVKKMDNKRKRDPNTPQDIVEDPGASGSNAAVDSVPSGFKTQYLDTTKGWMIAVRPCGIILNLLPMYLKHEGILQAVECIWSMLRPQSSLEDMKKHVQFLVYDLGCKLEKHVKDNSSKYPAAYVRSEFLLEYGDVESGEFNPGDPLVLFGGLLPDGSSGASVNNMLGEVVAVVLLKRGLDPRAGYKQPVEVVVDEVNPKVASEGKIFRLPKQTAAGTRLIISPGEWRKGVEMSVPVAALFPFDKARIAPVEITYAWEHIPSGDAAGEGRRGMAGNRKKGKKELAVEDASKKASKRAKRN